ncbi:MAG: NTP pyrophosphohydrolase [Opitutaceae bacterium]|nr:NTP pyrophosphohydrolase [Opitutaceae bacterium]|tara:strand:- start:730 stop:1104 length:375 start_codon:yes stop_codon:yes gene_type:complete
MNSDLDSHTKIQQIKDQIINFATERDWQQFHTPKNLSMAIACEAAELMEHFLWQDSKESMATMENSKKRAEITVELADILIFSLAFANACELDVSSIIQEKMRTNAKKYPVEKARGRSEKYTEL